MLYYCVEDRLSQAVVIKLAEHVGLIQLIELAAERGGNGHIRKNLRNYTLLAAQYPVLVMTDLDTANCPPALRRAWFGQARLQDPLPASFIFAVAVKEVEAWLLADTFGVSSYLAVSPDIVPADVEDLPDPKRTLITIAKRSRDRSIKSDIVPSSSRAKVGLGYNSRLVSFIEDHWNVQDAANNSESLSRLMRKLTELQA